MSEIIADYVITNELGDDTALIFPDDSSSGGGGGSPQTPPASFGPGLPHIVGTIGGAQWGPSISRGGAFACDSGLLTVPLPDNAEYSSGSVAKSSPGLISGVEFSKTDTTSAINSGMINLAAANAASRCDGTVDGTAGGVHGVGYSTNGQFAINKGFVLIPKPAELDGIAGLYNAGTAKGMTWAELRGAGPVRLSYSDSHGYGIMAMMFDNYLSLFIS